MERENKEETHVSDLYAVVVDDDAFGYSIPLLDLDLVACIVSLGIIIKPHT